MSKNTVIGIFGSIVDFSNLPNSVITLFDITHRLARIRRFNGGTQHSYSVAQHSLVMQAILKNTDATPKVQQLALMHDMTEAFMGDMVSPLKGLFPEFSKMEDELFNIICKELRVLNDFTDDEWQQVKEIDRYLTYAEWYVLNDCELVDKCNVWQNEYGKDVVVINPHIKLIKDILKDTDSIIELKLCNAFNLVSEQARAQRSGKEG